MRVVGEVHGEVTQTCIVSLDPFPVEIEEPIDVKFAPAAPERKAPARAEEVILLEMDDEPDPIVDGQIDLGALAGEFLALALDPYPRKPGVEFTPPKIDDEDSPFDALTELAKKKP